MTTKQSSSDRSTPCRWFDRVMKSVAKVILTFLFTAFAGGAHAEKIETEIVKGDLIGEHLTVAPGSRTSVALAMTLEPEWHTYWKNAGDSGQPIEVHWETPDGIIIGEMEWPAPERQPYEPMMNYGYADAVSFVFPIDIPDTWPSGKPVDLKAQVYWLVCNEVCIPDQGEVSVRLPTGENTVADPSVAEVFTDARASQPQANPYSVRYEVDAAAVRLRFEGSAFAPAVIEDVYFFPDEFGLIDHAAIQTWSVDATGLTVEMAISPESENQTAAPISGVLEIIEKNPSGALRLTLDVTANPGSVPAAVAASWTSVSSDVTLPLALGLAVLGGIILNLMPCVFPILALKTLGFAQTARLHRSERIAHGLAYTAGILVLFGGLGGAFLALKSTGAAIGWGYQLQNPLVVALLAYILIAVGLNLSGVFEVRSRLGNLGSDAASQGGVGGAFFTGALAAVVATPCTAPFMATAMGATLTMSGPATMAVFAALGLGLAIPFLALSLFPVSVRWIPRPGPWMERLKQGLAFPMYVTAAWLIWVLGAQTDPDTVFAALVGAVLLGFAGWAFGAGQVSGRRGSRLGTATAVVAVAGAFLLVTQWIDASPGARAEAAAVSDDRSERYSAARLASLRAAGKPVFINMTADWCITCKVNERVALGEAFKTALNDRDIAYLKGDWTKRDPEITALLTSFGRAGVPLYVVFPRQGEPILLPQILTSHIVLDALDKV